MSINNVATNLFTPKPCRLYINVVGSQCLQTNYGSNDQSIHAKSKEGLLTPQCEWQYALCLAVL